MQNDLADWLESKGLEVGRNIVGLLPGRRELDIVVLSHALAIEFNGLYWHKDKPGTYHKEKTDTCDSMGLGLLHVFEDEWTKRRPIVEWNILRHIGLDVMYTRPQSCRAVGLNKKESESFFEANHLDGHSEGELGGATTTFGLVNEKNELVSTLMVERNPYDKNQLRVVRQCHKLHHLVPHEGLKLLFKEVSKLGCEEIIWTTSTQYGKNRDPQMLGFEERQRWIDSWWTDGHDRIRHIPLDEMKLYEDLGWARSHGCEVIQYEFRLRS
jgi:hypothetical protein